MTDRPLSSGQGFDPDETRELDALGITRGRLAGCPDPALVLALDEGVLDADVAARVREHVAACPACQSAAADLARVFDEDAPPESLRRIDARLAAVRQKPARGLSYWLVPAGGLALAAAGLIWFLVRTPEPPAPDAVVAKDVTSKLPTVFGIDRPAIPHGEIDLAVRGEAPTPAEINNDVALALDQADAGDVSGAMTALEALVKTHPETRRAGLALGALQLKTDRNADALASLERVKPITTDAAMNDEVDWYLAIALVRDRQRDRARGLLDAICKTAGPRSTRACAGVAEIDRAPR